MLTGKPASICNIVIDELDKCSDITLLRAWYQLKIEFNQKFNDWRKIAQTDIMFSNAL